jgi:hypothetical protein
VAKVLCICDKRYAVAVTWNSAVFGKVAKKVHIYMSPSPKMATVVHKVIEKINRKTFIEGRPLFSNIEVEMILFPEKEISSNVPSASPTEISTLPTGGD